MQTRHEVFQMAKTTGKKEETSRLTGVIIRCAKLLSAKEDFDLAMDKTLAELGKATLAERVYLLFINGDSVRVMYEWLKSEGLFSTRELFDGKPSTDFADWKGNGKSVSYVLKDFPLVDEKVLDEKSAQFFLTNSIRVPLYHSGDLVGYLAADNFDESRIGEVTELMEVVSFLIVAEFVNHKLKGDISTLNNTDLLTGVFNRGAMNAKIAEVEGKEYPVGAAYANINGIRRVNESEGREAGDLVIKRAAECLTQIFRKREVYRSEGDEFVVLMPEISEGKFLDRLAAFAEMMEEGENVSIAFGSAWARNAWDVRAALHAAEKEMRADKKRYYKEKEKSGA